jgi:hypothetical protein
MRMGLGLFPLILRLRTRHGTSRAAEGRDGPRNRYGVLFMGPNALARYIGLEPVLT